MLWSRNENVVQAITDERMNSVYLPGVYLDPSIEITSELGDLSECDVIIMAIASQSLRAQCIAMSDLLPSKVPLMIACKGIERGSLMLMHEVVETILPQNPVAVISGPNFASEIAKGLPAATVIASAHRDLSEKLSYAIGGRYFRPYLTDDVAGVEMGGAIKNVIAIGAGIAAGRELGDNARAAIITRGVMEMQRLADIKGGRPETLTGLAGLGDLMLSCSSLQSRNMSLGYRIGREATSKSKEKGTQGLTEGVITAASVAQLAQKQGVSVPICEIVHRILSDEVSVDQAIQHLISRPFVDE